MSNLNIDPEEWMKELFEYEYCCECGGDTRHHTAVPFMSNWLARCDFPPDENGNWHPIIKTFREKKEIKPL